MRLGCAENELEFLADTVGFLLRAHKSSAEVKVVGGGERERGGTGRGDNEVKTATIRVDEGGRGDKTYVPLRKRRIMTSACGKRTLVP